MDPGSERMVGKSWLCNLWLARNVLECCNVVHPILDIPFEDGLYKIITIRTIINIQLGMIWTYLNNIITHNTKHPSNVVIFLGCLIFGALPQQPASIKTVAASLSNGWSMTLRYFNTTCHVGRLLCLPYLEVSNPWGYSFHPFIDGFP